MMENSAIESNAERSNDVDSDSEFNLAHESECQTTVLKSYNETRSTPLTERNTKKSSSRNIQTPPENRLLTATIWNK